MAAQISVQITSSAIPSLQNLGPGTSESLEIMNVIKELGLVLKSMHPDVSDPLLASYFTVDVADFEDVPRVIERLLGCGGILAAFSKPPEGMP